MKQDNELIDINIYKEFWSQEILDILDGKINDFYKNKLSLNVQYTKWNYNVVLDSNAILINDLSNDNEFIQVIKKELDKIYDTSKLRYFECGLHFLFKGSYIPWHDDGGCTFSCTTYLNKEEWNWNWGGALMYQRDEMGAVDAIFPEYNKMVAGYDGVKHSTSILSPLSKPRVSLQIFSSPEEFYPYK